MIRSVRISFALCCLAVSVCALAACGQQAQSGQRSSLDSTGPVQRPGIFQLDVAVTDSSGNPVTGLSPADFTLRDNGQPTRIFTLHSSTGPEAASDPPPELIFVLDGLDLDSAAQTQAQQALGQFLTQNGGHLAQPVILYWSAGDAVYASPHATTDGNELARLLAAKKGPRILWSAPMFDPAQGLDINYSIVRNTRCIEALGSIAIDQREIPGRKMLIWLSSGWAVKAGGPNEFQEVVELVTRLREARITVNMASIWPNPDAEYAYSDYLDPPRSQKDMAPGRFALQVVAPHTGGLILNQSGDLKADIERLAAESRAFYALTFDPPHTDREDEYHEVSVSVAHPGLTARTASGYYNQPVYFDHPRPNVERVTAAQLEAAIEQAGNSDLTKRLENMELTERLSTSARERLLALLHRDKERQALTAVADLAEFLPLPSADRLSDPPPAGEQQLEILSRALDYIANTLPKLPNFFATRTAATYTQPAVHDGTQWKSPLPDQTLRVSFSTRGTVLYRNGAEVVEVESSKGKHSQGNREHGLDTRGTFGPALASVLAAAATGQGKLTWGGWEQLNQAKLAVFHFEAFHTKAVFELTYCCLPEGDGATPYHKMAGYSGDFAVDPVTGEVLRLAIVADLDEDRDPHAPLIRSALMIEYGPVEIAGHRYILPQRSVSISRGRTLRFLHDWRMSFIVYAPFETMLNDFTFSGYHKFGSEARILQGFEPAN